MVNKGALREKNATAISYIHMDHSKKERNQKVELLSCPLKAN
jgi:hypothetical protein